MTTKPPKAQTAARRLPPLPDPPKMDMQQHTHYVMTGVPIALALHLGTTLLGSTTLVSGEGYLCRRRSDLPSCPYPDMLVAFGVDPDSIIASNGYVIEEVGKLPDLVLEVASQSTRRRDYIDKRRIYAGLGVPEYWRFDYTGGRHQYTGLAGDQLAEGVYRPIEMTTEPDGVVWGYSEVLGLSVCWVEGRLRFWDRSLQSYLRTQQESEARVRELEEQLRRRESL